ncbi:MAG: hypothetical protein RR275_08455 [Lachnospiraceae bacterium]
MDENTTNIPEVNIENTPETNEPLVSEPVPESAQPVPESAQPVPDPVPEQKVYQQPITEQTNYSYNTAYNSTAPKTELDDSPLSMGEWVLTILAVMIPCFVGIGLYFYWSFSKKGNINRQNFCRAALIVYGVLFVIYLLFMMLFGFAFISSMN